MGRSKAPRCAFVWVCACVCIRELARIWQEWPAGARRELEECAADLCVDCFAVGMPEAASLTGALASWKWPMSWMLFCKRNTRLVY